MAPLVSAQPLIIPSGIVWQPSHMDPLRTASSDSPYTFIKLSDIYMPPKKLQRVDSGVDLNGEVVAAANTSSSSFEDDDTDVDEDWTERVARTDPYHIAFRAAKAFSGEHYHTEVGGRKRYQPFDWVKKKSGWRATWAERVMPTDFPEKVEAKAKRLWRKVSNIEYRLRANPGRYLRWKAQRSQELKAQQKEHPEEQAKRHAREKPVEKRMARTVKIAYLGQSCKQAYKEKQAREAGRVVRRRGMSF